MSLTLRTATYGFMDGEHAFSAALVLVMANVAFPYNDRDARSMNSALSILDSMANKGNEYIRARHELLLNLRSAMSEQAGRIDSPSGSAPYDMDTVYTVQTDTNDSTISAAETPKQDFQHFQDLSFNLEMDESHDSFFDEFTGNNSIGFGSGWMGSFQRGQI